MYAREATSEYAPGAGRVRTAGVLVGGASRRMGRPKAFLPHPAGGTYVEHVVRLARAVADEVVLLGEPQFWQTGPAGAGWGAWPVLAGLRVLKDDRPGRGPLAGLCSLLSCVGDGWSLLLACDMPLLEGDLLEALLDADRADADAVVFERTPRAGTVAGGTRGVMYHACCGLYHGRVFEAAQRELEGGRGALQAVLRAVRVRGLSPDAEQSRRLVNVNWPDDIEAL